MTLVSTESENKATRPPIPAAVLSSTSQPGATLSDTPIQKYPTIAIERIEPSANNPRKTFNAEKMAELVASVAAQGVVEPIVVRPTWTQLGAAAQQYEIVCGERRWRAAKDAGLKEIPAIVRELTDLQAREIQVTENEQREDVTALEQARGYASLLDAFAKAEPKATRETLVKKLAARIGKSERLVWARLKLATDLAPEVAKALEAGEITASHADELVRLAPAAQKQFKEICFTKEWQSGKNVPVLRSLRETRDEIAELRMKLDAAPWKKDDATLVAKAGACTACVYNTLNNKREYPSAKGSGECLSRPCFEEKRQAFVQIRMAEARLESGLKATKPILKLATSHGDGDDEKGSIPSWEWNGRTVKAKEDAKEVGVIVDGADAGKIVYLADRQSGGGSSYRETVTPSVRLAARKKTVREKGTRDAGIAVLAQIEKKAPATPSLDVLKAIAWAMYKRFWNARQKSLIEYFGLDVQKSKGGYGQDTEAPMFNHIGSLKTPAEVNGLLLVMTYYSAAVSEDESSWGRFTEKSPFKFADVVKLLKVDDASAREPIEQQVQAKLAQMDARAKEREAEKKRDAEKLKKRAAEKLGVEKKKPVAKTAKPVKKAKAAKKAGRR